MALAIYGGWFAGRWCAADTIAEFAPPVEDGGIDTAKMAARWAPDDPLPHMRLAALYQKNFTRENLAAAVHECQLAVEASPYDYR